MQNLNYFALDLRKHLEYTTCDLPLFTFPEDAEEILIMFEIDDVQGKSIEPMLSKLLEQPRWVGMMKKDTSDAGTIVELPRGTYFFSQVREILDAESSAKLAAEVQKEALWERRRLGNTVYLRYLYEHDGPVTQIFRELLHNENT